MAYGQEVIASPVATSTLTLFDDGDPIWNHGVYDQGGKGRNRAGATSTGAPYSGTEYLTVWGDTQRSTMRAVSRVTAFVRNDVGLDHSKDWSIELDFANDLVSPDAGFSLWLFDSQPNTTILNADYATITSKATFWFKCGEQLPADDSRGGFSLTYFPSGAGQDVLTSPRLDPVPVVTARRGGHNYVKVLWLAGEQNYVWNISNIHGSWNFQLSAAALARHPTTTYFAAGTLNNIWWMGSRWTIHSLRYGTCSPPSPPPIVPISTRKQLFVDDYIIAELANLTRELGQVTKATS